MCCFHCVPHLTRDRNESRTTTAMHNIRVSSQPNKSNNWCGNVSNESESLLVSLKCDEGVRRNEVMIFRGMISN
jgi:hypothetical protein